MNLESKKTSISTNKKYLCPLSIVYGIIFWMDGARTG